MSDRIIKVEEVDDDEIAITLTGFSAASTNYDKRTRVYLSNDEADKLSFQIGSLLQDKDIRKRKQADDGN